MLKPTFTLILSVVMYCIFFPREKENIKDIEFVSWNGNISSRCDIINYSQERQARVQK